MKSLVNCCPESIIIAYKEDTTLLEQAILQEGFSVQVVKPTYTPRELSYSAGIRCFVTHAAAWRIAAMKSKPTVVMEADFVPSKGFGNMPVPIPKHRIHNSLGYLYACGPQIWDIEEQKYARGNAGASVALMIPPLVAKELLKYYDEVMATNPHGKYMPWDADIGYWLKARGIQSYMPYRQYGEHGGIQNPEHRRAGLGRQHRADVLNGDLHFMPTYAQGSKFIYFKTRLWARSWGVVRLLAGRVLALHDLRRSRKRVMLRYVVGRLFSVTQPS